MALHLHEPLKGAAPARFEGKKQKLPVPADSILQCHSCLRTQPTPFNVLPAKECVWAILASDPARGAGG